MATLEIPCIAVLHLLHYMAEDMINANLSKLLIVVIEIGLMPRITIGKKEEDSVAASRDLEIGIRIEFLISKSSLSFLAT